MRYIAGLMALLALAACGQGASDNRTPEEMAQVASRAANLRPSDARLSQIYERSCVSCHGQPGSGAPLTGDAIGWAPRLAKGNDTLLDSTIDGFLVMPPMGMCADCSAQDLSMLFDFMAGGSE